MPDKRFVLSVTVAGKEVVRRAVYAPVALDVAKMDVFSDDEFAMLLAATEDQVVNVSIVETA